MNTRFCNVRLKRSVSPPSVYWSVTVLKYSLMNIPSARIINTINIGMSVGIEFKCPRPSLNHQLPLIDSMSRLKATSELPQARNCKPIICHPNISQRYKELCAFDTPQPTFFKHT